MVFLKLPAGITSIRKDILLLRVRQKRVAFVKYLYMGQGVIGGKNFCIGLYEFYIIMPQGLLQGLRCLGKFCFRFLFKHFHIPGKDEIIIDQHGDNQRQDHGKK